MLTNLTHFPFSNQDPGGDKQDRDRDSSRPPRSDRAKRIDASNALAATLLEAGAPVPGPGASSLATSTRSSAGAAGGNGGASTSSEEDAAGGQNHPLVSQCTDACDTCANNNEEEEGEEESSKMKTNDDYSRESIV